MENVHTLSEMEARIDSGNRMEGAFGGGQSVFRGYGQIMEQNGGNHGQQAINALFRPEDSVVQTNDMMNEMSAFSQDAERLVYHDDDDIANYKLEKEKELLIRASETKLRREVGMQSKAIDIARNEAVVQLQFKLNQVRNTELELRRQIENIVKNATIQKAVIHRKMFRLKRR